MDRTNSSILHQVVRAFSHVGVFGDTYASPATLNSDTSSTTSIPHAADKLLQYDVTSLLFAGDSACKDTCAVVPSAYASGSNHAPDLVSAAAYS